MTDLRKPTTSVTIAGKQIPCYAWSVELAGHGKLGSAQIRSSIVMLTSKGIEVESLGDKEGASVEIRAGYDGDDEVVFTGLYDEAELILHEGEVVFHCTDKGAALQDEKGSVAGLSYKNKTVKQMAEEICKKAKIDKKEIKDGEVPCGHEYDKDRAYIPHAQSWWSMLQSLADLAGCECYFKPDGTLYFGKPKGSGSVKVTWGSDSDDVKNPLMTCEITHQPRRNKHFEVRVISYHPKKVERVKAKSKAVSTSKSTSAKVLGPTAIVGSSSGGSSSVSSSSSSGGTSSNSKKGKTKLYFRQDGLTNEQAKEKAESIAKEVARREIIVRGSIEGLPSMRIHQGVDFVDDSENGDMLGFDSRDYNITSITHHFSMPGEHGGDGFMTDFEALSKPAGFETE